MAQMSERIGLWPNELPNERDSIIETAPALSKQAEEMRRRLGTLDSQQVAIWREMTPARKLQLVFQMWYLARKIAWSTERQWHPELTEAELSQRVWKRFHGSDAPYVPANQT